MRLYVCDSRRCAAEAWPGAPREDIAFSDLTGAVTIADKNDAPSSVAANASEPTTLIAQPADAIPAVLAIAQGGVAVSNLVLVEPALYDIARGNPAIESHIATMSGARGWADSGDLFAFWSIVRPLMFGGSANVNTGADERSLAENFASVTLPWGHGVSAATIEQVPALVVTGAWNDECEAIAAKLVVHCGVLHQLAGRRHRPHDHPGFEKLLHNVIGTRYSEDRRTIVDHPRECEQSLDCVSESDTSVNGLPRGRSRFAASHSSRVVRSCHNPGVHRHRDRRSHPGMDLDPRRRGHRRDSGFRGCDEPPWALICDGCPVLEPHMRGRDALVAKVVTVSSGPC